MIILHIIPQFDDGWMKTLGGVRENAPNMPNFPVPLTPVTLTFFGRSKPYCPDAPFINTNISWKFRENQTMARGSNRCDGRTASWTDSRMDRPTNRRTDILTDRTIHISAKWQIKSTQSNNFSKQKGLNYPYSGVKRSTFYQLYTN